MSNESALSAIIRVKLKYVLNDTNTTQDLSLIVKELPKDAFSRFFVIEGQFDLREIKFYTQVSEQLIYATSCYINIKLFYPTNNNSDSIYIRLCPT